jgi:hypothetical protein
VAPTGHDTFGKQEFREKTNTVFLLEVLLHRHVYGRPLELKRYARIREAVPTKLFSCAARTTA